ncbi:MAG: Na+/H+ antiporter, partial [uncultured bacterium]
KLFTEFFESEKTGGLILIISTVFSLLAANLFIGQGYIDFWHKYVDLSFFGLELKYSIQHWINDGLVTVFFLLIGLEIERELYAGELSSFQKV